MAASGPSLVLMLPRDEHGFAEAKAVRTDAQEQPNPGETAAVRRLTGGQVGRLFHPLNATHC